MWTISKVSTVHLRLRALGSSVAGRPRQSIQITMPDSSNRDGTSWETSPMDIAKAISKSLSERVVIAKVGNFIFNKVNIFNCLKVDGGLWDLERPLERSCKLELLDFDDPEGKPRIFTLLLRS
jgi:threonyl-tRNA synthetase